MTYSYTHTVIELSCFNQNNISLSYQLACILVFRVIRPISHFHYMFYQWNRWESKNMPKKKILVVIFLLLKCSHEYYTHTHTWNQNSFVEFFAHERFLSLNVCVCVRAFFFVILLLILITDCERINLNINRFICKELLLYTQTHARDPYTHTQIYNVWFEVWLKARQIDFLW